MWTNVKLFEKEVKKGESLRKIVAQNRQELPLDQDSGGKWVLGKSQKQVAVIDLFLKFSLRFVAHTRTYNK